jgi:copper chaperone
MIVEVGRFTCGRESTEKQEEQIMNSTANQVTLVAPDISCAHCVATIENEVGSLPGVDRVQVDAGTKQVTVAFDPARVSLDQIEATLDEAGYPVAK